MIAETSSGMQISEARRLNLLKNTKRDTVEKAFVCP